MLEKAKKYLQAGLCVLPARRDLKIPILSWKPYQERLPTEDELIKWFSKPPDSLCLITGKVSGNLEIIDFDNCGESFEAWAEKIDQALLDRLVIERSQSGGWHVIYRYESAVSGSVKLAQRPEYDLGDLIVEKGHEYAVINGKKLIVRIDSEGRKFVVVLLIETRGEAGLFLCDPSPGYEVVQGSLTDLPVLNTGERDALLTAAWSFNQAIDETSHRPSVATTRPIVERPGDEFNYTADIRTLLKSHGWTYIETKGDGNECWRRPGKTSGISATLRHVDGHWQFYVFSSNAYPFEQNQSYSAFATYTMLEHNGDFESATRTLGSHGYGKPPTPESLGVDLSNFNTAPKKRAIVRELDFVRLSSFTRTEMQFLWRNRFIKGKLNLLGGDGSTGKTWFVCYMCATISTGRNWPDGAPCEQGGCIYFTSEDSAADTILPRVEDQGGDPDHVYMPSVVKNKLRGTQEEFVILDTDVLEQMIDKIEAEYFQGYIKLIVFDPVTAFMGLIDEFKNNQVRAAFRPIMRLAEERGITLLGLGHPKKNALLFGTAAEAWSGSVAYVNAARMVWNVYHDKKTGLRTMLASKFNLIEEAPGIEYNVRKGVVHFMRTGIDMLADDFLEEYRAKTRKGKRKLDNSEAEEWLCHFLKDGAKPCGHRDDPASADTIFGHAKRLKFGVNGIYEAAKSLHILKRKIGFAGQWIWELPSGDTTGEPAPECEEWNA